jgi:hypothetical protein
MGKGASTEQVVREIHRRTHRTLPGAPDPLPMHCNPATQRGRLA